MSDDTTTDPTTDAAVRTPLEVVQGLYAAFGQGDMPGLFALLDPEVDWSSDVQAPGAELVPMLHHGVGLGAVERYFGGVAELEFHAFDVVRMLVDGDVVLVEVHLDCTHRTTGKRAQIDEVHHWTVRNGLAVRYRNHADTATMIEVYRP